ncbi:hypothetical protein JFY74_03170 [Pectobacterium carotovorum]|nr:hypothetical protein JFY74_03170 [Pectobacterium carotovorum]
MPTINTVPTSTVVYADVHAEPGIKKSGDSSTLLNAIKHVDSSAIDDFKKKPNESECARKAFDELARKGFSGNNSHLEFRDTQLFNRQREDVKNILGIICPYISDEKDKKTFDNIIHTLSKDKEYSWKEWTQENKLGKAISELMIRYGSEALRQFVEEYRDICVDAWKEYHPGLETNCDEIFTEQERRYAALVGSMKDDLIKTQEGNTFLALKYYAAQFKDLNVSLAKTLRHHLSESTSQTDRALNPEHPAAKSPDAGLGVRMPEGGAQPFTFNPTFNPTVSPIMLNYGGKSSSSGNDDHPGLVNNTGMNWNAAFDSVLATGDLTEETKANLLSDIIKAASPSAFMNGGVLPNLQRVSAYTPDNPPQPHCVLTSAQSDPTKKTTQTQQESAEKTTQTQQESAETATQTQQESAETVELRRHHFNGTRTPSTVAQSPAFLNELKETLAARNAAGQTKSPEDIEKFIAEHRQQKSTVQTPLDEHLEAIRKGVPLKPIAGTTASSTNESRNEQKGHIELTIEDLGLGPEADDIVYYQQEPTPPRIPTPPPFPNPASLMSPNGAGNEPKDHIEQPGKVKIEDLGENSEVDSEADAIVYYQQEPTPPRIPTPPPFPNPASSMSPNGATNTNEKDVTDSASKVKQKPLYTSPHNVKTKSSRTKVNLQRKAENAKSQDIFLNRNETKWMPPTNGSASPEIDDRSNQPLRTSPSLQDLSSPSPSASIYTTSRTPDMFNRRQSKEPQHFNRIEVKGGLRRSLSWSSLSDKLQQEQEDKLKKSTMNS